MQDTKMWDAIENLILLTAILFGSYGVAQAWKNAAVKEAIDEQEAIRNVNETVKIAAERLLAQTGDFDRYSLLRQVFLNDPDIRNTAFHAKIEIRKNISYEECEKIAAYLIDKYRKYVYRNVEASISYDLYEDEEEEQRAAEQKDEEDIAYFVEEVRLHVAKHIFSIAGLGSYYDDFLMWEGSSPNQVSRKWKYCVGRALANKGEDPKYLAARELYFEYLQQLLRKKNNLVGKS